VTSSVDALALGTLDPTDLSFEEALGRPEVQVTPTTSRAVVVDLGGEAAGALVAPLSSADPHHHSFGRERYALNDDSIDGDNAIKCSGGAHVDPPAWIAWTLSKLRELRARHLTRIELFTPRPSTQVGIDLSRTTGLD
jgi:hypothetical protein